ncbi:MAG: hypothetical protein NC913_06310 [Candidatus Omnitrophica bacterium]|nr:hypothetical protein [Candidatus Omnitrophota bacterium]
MGTKKKKTKEISFDNFFTKFKLTAFAQEIENIREEYHRSGIHLIRNKIIAHKDARNVGDPLTHFMNRINKEFIDKAEGIIQRLRECIWNHFKEPHINNYIADFYGDSHKFIIDTLENSLDT